MALIKVSELSPTGSVKIDDLLLISTTNGTGYTSNHVSISDLVSSQPFIGLNGTSGTSGTSGVDGYTPQFGVDYFNGADGYTPQFGIDYFNGADGSSGTSGTDGSSGTSGTSGSSGSSGFSGDIYRTISNTNLTISPSGTTLNFTGGNGLSYTAVQSILIVASGSTTNYMEAEIISYDSLTGAFSVNVTRYEGSGTFSDWIINLDGASGGDGSSGTSGTSGTSGVNGTSGTSGTSGIDGTSGTSGTSGESGTSGTSGTSGLDGVGGEVRSFTNSMTWSVNHNLDTQHPIVTVWDNTNKVIIPGQITSIDNNNLDVTFTVPTSGYVNVVKGGDVITGSTAIAGTSGSSGTSGLSNFGGAIGAFSSTQTQTTTGSTVELMTFNSIDLSNNVISGTTTSEIKVLQSGNYNLQFSAQIQKTQGGSVENILIWFKKNGNDIPNSNTDVTLANNNHFLVASWNILVDLNANDTVSVAWYSLDQHVELVAVPNPTAGPSIPSVIITLTQV